MTHGIPAIPDLEVGTILGGDMEAIRLTTVVITVATTVVTTAQALEVVTT